MADIGALRREAERAMREGRLDDAIRSYRSWVAIDPAVADAWYNLGYLYRCTRRFDEALTAYATAIERGIDRPEEVHLNRAVIQSEFRERIDDALLSLHHALRIAPAFLPAWLNLGNLHSDLGDAASARHAYERALALDGRNGRAQAKLAAIDVFEGKAPHAIDRLRRLLSAGGLAPEDAAEIGFALANSLDAVGDYDAAFATLGEAHRIATALIHPAERYDPRRTEARVDALIRAEPPSDERSSSDEPGPIFICGMFRSGSTLTERILARHSRVISGGELEIIPAFAAGHQGSTVDLMIAPQGTIDELRRRYLDEIRTLYPAGRRVTDKRSDNFLHIGLIRRMFPAAPIVNTLRNDFDTALSIYGLYFDGAVNYGHSLSSIGHWIRHYHRLMDHWRALYDEAIHDVSYDDLVARPAPVVGDLLTFCDLEWEDAVLQPDRGAVIVRTASVWQVRSALHGRSSGRWRNYERHLQPLIDALGYAPG